MSPPRVLALDLALAVHGVCLPDGTYSRIEAPGEGVHRLAWVADFVARLVKRTDADLVAFEGFSFASATVAYSLGSAGGVARLAVYDLRVPQVDVPSSSLKMYATGSGSAKKVRVILAAAARLGYSGDDDNEADALWLRAMALDAYGVPVASVPATHRRALKAIRWPRLQERPEAALVTPAGLSGDPGGDGG